MNLPNTGDTDRRAHGQGPYTTDSDEHGRTCDRIAPTRPLTGPTAPPDPVQAHRPAPRSDVDPARWPDVARPPADRVSRWRGAAAGLLLERTLRTLPLRVRLGDGPPTGGGLGGPSGPLLHIRDPDVFFRRVGRSGLLGFGESYMAGEWHSDDLVGTLTVLASHVDDLVPSPLRRLRGLWLSRRPAAQRNTPDGVRRNVRRHYDLSNDLFAAFLDPTLSYSSAVFDRLPAREEDFAAAQRRKIDRLLDLAAVGPGTRLLEIGTGWGELALRAAARGARVVTVTLSDEQRRLAEQRVAEARFEDRVHVRLCDYRDVDGAYDAVMSVEMIEAVGAEYWPDYFSALRRLCAPGGRIALQAITMPHDRMLNTRRTHTWINAYVFPGGLIPSRKAVADESAAAGLRVVSDTGYGEHYAETLRLWRERFLARADHVAALGFDTVFRRMWELYLAYSEAGFQSRYLDVRQLLLVPRPAPGSTRGSTERKGTATR
ncbi:class I SAM-dependent methyltransferase [Streptomyces sp. MUM 203J]|uniref:SAM-dependent methyltransferase n=1 Tax=Streptomyces sp. MUM 203J TaxID=2791990 RepID=UPI001F042527|nr:cyclopropane-fatty-acyl-phospholipid synthase family protein [Streptomyces sp. MUM 203J]MCH0542110.1 class I SAM-dependent methyltransferase [Streptomyces sp. MUM 203J]